MCSLGTSASIISSVACSLDLSAEAHVNVGNGNSMQRNIDTRFIYKIEETVTSVMAMLKDHAWYSI